MKLISYTHGDVRKWGVQDGEIVRDATSVAASLDEFVSHGPAGLDSLREQLGGLPAVSVSEVRIGPPLQRPSKIIAIGLNYRDHCRETHTPEPTTPVVFTKFSSAIIGTGDEIRWSTAQTTQVDWEVELGVVIGKPAYQVSAVRALDYVYGYTVVNDISARDRQQSEGQWVRAKSFDTFCPLGPAIVTADEIPDPQSLDLSTKVNGNTMQSSNTKEMIFTVAYLIEFLSSAVTLRPGDVIATGTPHGVGLGMKPPVFLKDGDVVEASIDGIGTLRNPCRVTG